MGVLERPRDNQIAIFFFLVIQTLDVELDSDPHWDLDLDPELEKKLDPDP